MKRFDFIISQKPIVFKFPVEVLDVTEPYQDGFFVLNPSRFSAENPVLYSTKGRQIAEVSVQNGELSEKVYVNSDGLHVTGDTRAAFPVELPASGKWTVIYRIKGYTLGTGMAGSAVHMLFDSSGANLETACVSNWNQNAVHFRLISDRNGTYQLFNGTQASGYSGFFDYAVPPSDLQYYELEYRWLNDGENLSLYVSGVKKASVSLENLPDISSLFMTLNSNPGANADDLTVTHFEVKNSAELPEYTLYRWRLTGFRGSDTYAAVRRLCLYDASGNRLDTGEQALAFALANGSSAVYPANYPDSRFTCLALTGNRSGKLVINRNSQIDMMLSVPGGADLKSYSYITCDDFPNREPVSWILSKSLDGGQTWEELDRQTNVSITTERNTETQKFVIGGVS